MKAVLGRSSDTNLPEGLLNMGLEAAVWQGNFETVGMFLGKKYRSKQDEFLQRPSECHESIVDLLLQLCYGVKKRGPAYEEAALQATRGWGEGRGHVKIVHSLLASGEFTDLAQLTICCAQQTGVHRIGCGSTACYLFYLASGAHTYRCKETLSIDRVPVSYDIAGPYPAEPL